MTIASKTAISKVTAKEYIYGMVISTFFFALSLIFWKMSVKKYGSASS
jgi:ABC-type uncharacterized transport system permease subunit